MTNYYWNNCYRWSKSTWDKYNALPEDTKRALTEGGEKQDWLLKYEKQLGRLPPWLTQPPKSLQIDCKTGNPIDADAGAIGNSDSSDLLNETPFPWEKWEKLPKEEREAEMKEAMKQYYQAEDLRQQIINGGGDPDSLKLQPQYRKILSGASEVEEIDLLTGDTSANPADNNWAFENNTESTSEPETLSPIEFDVAAPLMTDQAVVGDQLEAVGSGVCGDLRWIVPEQDLPFGCK